MNNNNKMYPLSVLERKAFLISALVYDWSKEILIKIEKGTVAYPKIHVHTECLALQWLNCELYIYDYFAILITDIKKYYYTLPDHIDEMVMDLDSIVTIKRSKPIKIEN